MPGKPCTPPQVEDLARLSFRRQPLYVGVDDTQEAATREGLEQGYCCVPSAQRFLLLFTFLKKNAGKKARPHAGRPPHTCSQPHRCPLGAFSGNPQSACEACRASAVSCC